MTKSIETLIKKIKNNTQEKRYLSFLFFYVYTKRNEKHIINYEEKVGVGI